MCIVIYPVLGIGCGWMVRAGGHGVVDRNRGMGNWVIG